MKQSKQIGKRLIALSTVLAMGAISAACQKDPAAPATAASPSHGNHGQSTIPSPEPLRAGERFVTLTMDKPYHPVAPNGGNDEYRCFVVDPKLTEIGYLTGSQFLPQNADIVHHAVFYRIKPTDVAMTREADEREPGEGWQCFGGGTGIKDNVWVAHWTPGLHEVLLAPGLGYEMPPGSLLVMQVHYNLLAAKGKTDSTDQSSIRLRLADGSATTPLETVQLVAPIELPCTAQESGPLCDRGASIADVTHRFGEEVGRIADDLSGLCSGGKPAAGITQHCDHTMGADGTVHAAAGHMHLLGRSIKIELNPGTPNAVTLLDVPQFNFDDQAIIPLAKPTKISKGDVVRVTCTHDAGLRKLLPQLQPLPPRYVVWGDGSSDEMCLGLLTVTRP